MEWNRTTNCSVNKAMTLIRHFVAVLVLVAAAALSPAWAGDDLDTLFAKLRDPASGAKVLSIEPQIWDAWMHQGSNTENEALAKATQTMNLGLFSEADKQLTALVATAPGFAEAWNKRATLYFIMGKLEESLSDITKVLDLEPRHFGALSGRGMIYQKQGKNPEALAAFKDALVVNPTMPGARIAVQQLEKLVPEL
jgi:tetratricopeptide (TPR) repeat protein